MIDLFRLTLVLTLGVATGIALTHPVRTAVLVRRAARKISPPPRPHRPHRPHRHAYNAAQLVSRN